MGTVGFDETSRFFRDAELVDVEPSDLVISHSHFMHNHLERFAANGAHDDEGEGEHRVRHRSVV